MPQPSETLAELKKRAYQLTLKEPTLFAKACGITPEPWQEKVLRSRAPRVILNCARQRGKSTVGGLVALQQALVEPKSLVLLLAPSLRQSGELFRNVMGPFRNLEGGHATVEESKLAVEFSNGSRVICLPETEGTIRGFAGPKLIIIDEAAFCGNQLMIAVRPMLIRSHGRLMLMSTPDGRKGFFYDAWHIGKEAGWEKHLATAYDHPPMDADMLAKEKSAIGSLRFQQEYECAFIAGHTGLVYAYTFVNKSEQTPKNFKFHLLAIDYGFNDECAFTVLAWNPDDTTVYILSSKKYASMIPSNAAEHTKTLEEQFHFTRIIGDTGGLGKGYAEEARSRFGIPVEQAEKHNKRGYIDLFNDALRTGKIKVVEENCEDLLSEYRELVWDEHRQKESSSFPNHCADATLYGWRASTAFLNTNQPVKPKHGTEEYFKEEEKRLLAEVDEELEREERNDRLRQQNFWSP